MEILRRPIFADCSENLIRADLANALVQGLWGLPPGSDFAYSGLLHFYFAQVTLIDSRELVVKSHQDVIDIVAFVQARLERSMTAIREELAQVKPSWLGQAFTGSVAAVELAFRLWLMVAPDLSDYEDKPIGDSVSRLFPQSGPLPGHEKVDCDIDARSMQQLAGIRIVKTNTLSDHLLYDKRSRILSVFAHKEILRNQQGAQLKFVLHEISNFGNSLG